ncbi:MAG: hypothetical protein H6551_13035 [Chitinophagales bacterium]|nr:hypothetical protein [Chitinophagaceae bacterium]MCB9066057.1 hypothetical protein [Chitinophagales bacterium]
MRRHLFATVMAVCFSLSFTQAQEDAPQAPKGKLFQHQVGVQMNDLIRQVFNFSDVSNPPNNPYLLIYHLNLAKSGWGVRLGVGPEIRAFKNDDGITETDNDIFRMNARLGFEKAFALSDRWSVGVGLDGVYENELIKTKSTIRSFDSARTDVTSKLITTGGGTMAWLRYNVTPNITIGTETSFYYRVGTFQQGITVTRKIVQGFPGGSQEQTTNSEIDTKERSGTFSLPTVFYIIVRF